MSALPEPVLAWRPLGEILLERGLISHVELDDALRQQEQEGGRLGEILFARGLVSAIDLRDALATQHGLDLRVETPTTKLQVVSEERQRALPLGRLLVKRDQITEAQLDTALSEQAVTGQRLGQILIASGAISPFTLAAALAEQQGLLNAGHAQPRPGREPRRYEVREVIEGKSHRLYDSNNFLDATDLAFAVLHEWEPRELHVVCIAEGDGEQLCWQYPPAE